MLLKCELMLLQFQHMLVNFELMLAKCHKMVVKLTKYEYEYFNTLSKHLVERKNPFLLVYFVDLAF